MISRLRAWLLAPLRAEFDAQHEAQIQAAYRTGVAYGQQLGRAALIEEFEAMFADRRAVREVTESDVEAAKKRGLH